MYVPTVTTNGSPVTCPCCNGSKIQILSTGEKVICKACKGIGVYPPSPPQITC